MTPFPPTTHWSPGFRLCGVYVGKQAQACGVECMTVEQHESDTRPLCVEAIRGTSSGAAELRLGRMAVLTCLINLARFRWHGFGEMADVAAVGETRPAPSG